MIAENSFPQLSFEINNPDAANTIYITNDPAVNKLTFKITTNKGGTTFTPGVLVPKKDAPSATGSILYLDLTALKLSDVEFNNLQCSAIDWIYQLYPADRLICLTPQKVITLGSGAGQAIDIDISQLTIGAPPSVPNVSLNTSSFRVIPASSGKIPQVSFFKVLLQHVPEGREDLHPAIACELSTPSSIYNTIEGYDPVENSLAFVFKPGYAPKTVNAGPNTVFTLSFVYADAWPGYGALTSPLYAAKISVNQGVNASDWIVTRDPDEQNPCWLLVPPDKLPIIGTGVKSIVEFNITRIITVFEPGPTLLFVQYANIPGYDDGSYYILLNKIPHVSISKLSVTPNPSVLKNGKSTITVGWKAKDYALLTLMPFYKDVTSETSTSVTIEGTGDITLVANGLGGIGNTVNKTVTANVLPSINSFAGTPTNVYSKDFPHEVKFYWDVETNKKVFLVNDRDGTKESVGKTDIMTKSVTGPGMWSIIPEDTSDVYTLQRNVLIQAFNQESGSISLNFTPFAIVASPTAQFVAAINQAAGSVEILNALTYDRYASPIEAGPGLIDIIFSTDGHYLFALNEKDDTGSMTIIKVTYDPAISLYVFEIVNTMIVNIAPRRMAVSQDGRYVFISGNDAATDQGFLIVIEKLSTDIFAIKSTIDVGLNAAGLTSGPAGGRVYVTNTGSNSVSVIGYSSLSDSFSRVWDITDINSEPVDIAAADPLGNTLLIVCTGSNALVVIDHDDRGSSDRQKLPLGVEPQRIAITSSRAYAFVTNKVSNTTTLIGCSGGVAKCKVLETAISTVKNPFGISISPDDAMALVGSSSEKAGSVFNLVNYKMQRGPVAVGSLPTDLVASDDKKNIVVWHNTLINIGKGTYSKGIFIYNLFSGTVTQKLDTLDIIECIFSPDNPTKKLFVIAKDDNNISVLDATTFSLQLKIPIPDGPGSTKQLPVDISIADDGRDLFAVVKTTSGEYSLIIYASDIATNSYTVIFNAALFTSTIKSNLVLLANAPDGSYAFVLNVFDQNVYTASRDKTGGYTLNPAVLKIRSLAKSIVVTPDNLSVYILTQQGIVTGFTIIDIQQLTTTDHALPASYRTIVNLQRLAISPDGSRLFVTDSDITGIRVISTVTLRIIQTLSWPQDIRFPMGISILPDASSIYFACLNSNNIAQINQINS